MVSEEGARIEWSTTPPPNMVYHDDGDWRTEVRTHVPFRSVQFRSQNPHVK